MLGNHCHTSLISIFSYIEEKNNNLKFVILASLQNIRLSALIASCCFPPKSVTNSPLSGNDVPCGATIFESSFH